MNDLPPLPKGYTLADRGVSLVGLGQSADVLYTYPGFTAWSMWGNLYREDWEADRAFAVRKPRCTCPLEFSRYV